MGTAFVETRRSSRKPLTALEIWTVGTLAGMILLLMWLQVVVVGGLFPPLTPIFGVPALVVAVIILAVHRRWELGPAVVGIAAGVAAIARNYQAPSAANEQERGSVPRWFSPMFWSVAGLCVAHDVGQRLLGDPISRHPPNHTSQSAEPCADGHAV
jgi:hypothetical protein